MAPKQFTVAFLLLTTLLILSMCTHATLVGIQRQPTKLATFDPLTGKFINPESRPELSDVVFPQQLSSMDLTNEIFYLIGLNTTSQALQLIGLDVNTGHTLSSVVLPFVTTVFLGFGETCNVDPRNGHVYVSGKLAPATNNTHTVLRVIPKTGKLDVLIQFDALDMLSGSASAFDPQNGVLWLELGARSTFPSLFGIDVDRAVIKFDALSNKFKMQSMYYDPKTSLMTGIGLIVGSNNTYSRTLVTLDGVTGETNAYGTFDDYVKILANMTPIDYVNRIIYAFMSIDEPQAPMDFVGYSFNGRELKQVSKVNIPSGKTPASLQYIPN